MEKSILDKLKIDIDNYNMQSLEEQEIINNKTELVWFKIFHEYKNLCEQDSKLIDAINEINRINNILAYDFSEEFEIYSHTINAFDPEFSERIYKYSAEKYNLEKETAENWEKIKSEHLTKIEKINKRKLPFFKTRMLEKVTSSLEEKERMVKHYNDALAKENQRKEYAKKKDELLNPLEKFVRERENEYAEQVINKNILTNPTIICVKRASLSSSMFINSEPLNTICNAIMAEIYQHNTKKQEPSMGM